MRILTPSILAAAFLLAGGSLAKQACAQTPAAGPAVEAAYQAILANPKVIKTLEDIKADDDTAFAEQKRITEIPAPPYKEKVRAKILSEAVSGTRLQGRRHRQRRQCDRSAQGQRRRQAEAGGVGASRHRISRRHRC
jgi:hypothetical protein